MSHLPKHLLDSFKEACRADGIPLPEGDEEVEIAALDLLDIVGSIAQIGVDQELREEKVQGGAESESTTSLS